MTEPGFDGSNPDAVLLRHVNDLARSAPHWLDSTVCFLGEYGLVALSVLLVLWCWWRVARRLGEDAPSAVAGVAWTGLAAVIALLLSLPVRQVVQRPRPFDEQSGLYVLLRHTSRFSFVDNHATLTMAVGVGLFMVHRKAGVAGMAIALLAGFARVLMGVNYPTDVIGGYALGTAAVLLLAPLAMVALGPLTAALGRGRAAVLVRSAKPQVFLRGGVGVWCGRAPEQAAETHCEKDLAA